MSSPTWGTGYGAMRHLVRAGTVEDREQGRLALSVCGYANLSYFSDGGVDEISIVWRRQACGRCLRSVL